MVRTRIREVTHMMRISRPWMGGIVLLAALALAAPALAQTGGVRGKVLDQAGKPVPDAVVEIESKAMSRKLQVKTSKKGEYIQIGLYPGEYKVTATKDSNSASVDLKVGIGDPEMLDIKIGPAAPSKAQAEQNAKVTALFDEGVAAAKASRWDDAIAKFTEASTMVPNCYVCFFNIGAAYYSKDDQVKAEENYKKSVEIKPDYADGWNALASLYNQQKKFDLAGEASEKATAAVGGGAAGGAPGAAGAGGGSASVLYNQGVIFWNQNKYSEAKDKWEAATKADPKYAEAFYRLGMAYMNLVDMTKAVGAFEGYLVADPNGSHAAEVKQAIDALKPKN
jgi:tetratricopeptide (TPR) repeat protein